MADISSEAKFHDQWAESVEINNIMVDEFFEACTSPENRLILSAIGELTGKKILELGAGLGEASIYFAKNGAIVTATDISDGMLNVIRKMADLASLKHIECRQCASNDLPFKDSEFDIVYAANLLHHTDIEATLKEASRVLKKGGLFVSWDPLAHNPFINIYRKKAMEVRTADEHPIKMNQLSLFRKYFSHVRFETTWFFTLWIFIKYYIIDKVDPNKERYWKKILSDHKKLEKIYYPLERIDHIVLSVFPFLKRYCWNIVVIGRK